jgi:signal transduction histidine kinase
VLADFIALNREVIIARASERVSARGFRAPEVALTDGIPGFLDQLCGALRAARASLQIDHDGMRASAERHGHDLLRLGLTIAQVVQCYSDVCQVVTALALERQVSIPYGEFQTLNVCVDDAMANAVTEYSGERERAIVGQGTERLGMLAHELRNVLNTASLSYEIIKSGRVAIAGSTGLVLGRSLLSLRSLVDRSLAEVRLDAGLEQMESIGVADFLDEVEIGASLQADACGVRLAVGPVDRAVNITGDRETLAAALSNLLQNAFKFTARESQVSLVTRISAERVSFQVEDECGGLPAGKAEDLFRPFRQKGTNRSGIGLGLSICLKAAKAHDGKLSVVDLAGKGCVFTLDLPRAEQLPGRTTASGEVVAAC